MRIFISSPLFYKGGKLMKASDLNLIGSWNVSDILIKTKDEVIEFDIVNKIKHLYKENKTELKIYFELYSDDLIEKLMRIKNAEVSYCLRCQSYDNGERFNEVTNCRNMSFYELSKTIVFDKITSFVLILKEE